MKTRYWKGIESGVAWKLVSGVMFSKTHPLADWRLARSEIVDLEADSDVIECTSDGTPLDSPAEDRMTMDEIRAFFKRLEANYEALMKEEAR